MNVAYDIDETILDMYGRLIKPIVKKLIEDYYNGCKIFFNYSSS